MRYMMLEKTKFLINITWKCCDNQSKPHSHFQYSKLSKWCSKSTFICNFCKELPNCFSKEIFHIYLLTYQTKMNQVFLWRFTKKSIQLKDQINSHLPLYVLNHESECKAEMCASCGMGFWTYLKNITSIK